MARICKVLVVEDNDDVRALVEDILGYEGYRFRMAKTGDEMRRIIAADPDIDALVIDVTLPGGTDGLALAAEMADFGYAVLLFTGDHSLVERIEKSGHRYLLKPFKIDSLLDLVALALKELKARCERPRRHA